MCSSLASVELRCVAVVTQLWPAMTSGLGSCGLVVAIPGEGGVGLGFTRSSELGYNVGRWESEVGCV